MPGDVEGDGPEEEQTGEEVAAEEVLPDGPADAPEPITVVDREDLSMAPGVLPAFIPRSVRSLIWQARIGLGLAVLFGALAVVLFVQASSLRADAADRQAALEAGQLIVLRITTFDGATIDDWVADVQGLATPAFSEQVAGLFDTEIRQGLAAQQVQSVGEITSSFVQEIRGDSATVFAVVRQSYTSANLPSPQSDELRFEVDLTRVDGVWLVADAAVLGPSVAIGTAPGGLPDAIPEGLPEDAQPAVPEVDEGTDG